MSKKVIKSLTHRYNPNQPNRLPSEKALEETLLQIKQLNVSPNPIHYTLLFESINEIDPYFSSEIQKAVSNNTYNNDVAETLYIELISQYIQSQIPTTEVQSLITELLTEINNWISNTQSKQTLINDEIELVTQEALPPTAARRLQENILPAIQAVFDDTDHLHDQAIQSSLEIKKLKDELERAQLMAKTDELTNIPNRRGFNQAIAQIISEAKQLNQPFSLIILDIDFFKSINDEFGHLIGDSVLRYLAKQLNCETKGKDTIARIGGEEFVIILPNTGLEDAVYVANNLRLKIEKNQLKVKSHNKNLTLTISAGVAKYIIDETAEDIVERADQALYLAKNSGRNRVCHENELD